MPADRIHLRLYGGVQGVGFRAFIADAARRAGLRGYTRNLPDGSVQIEAAGDPDALQALRRTAQHGPPYARVQEVRELSPGSAELPAPFAIRR